MVNKYIALGIILGTAMAVMAPAHARNYDRQNYGYQNYGYLERENYGHPEGQNYGRRDRQVRTSQNSAVPSRISGGNIVKVDLGRRVWAAYDSQGNLVKSGRASGGKNYCPDIRRGCRTITGTFTFYNKKGPGCRSSRFPVGKGGAPMPYCMHFKGGYALHGGNVPNYNASHGCVRVPYADAQWLNQNFVRVGSTRVSIHY